MGDEIAGARVEGPVFVAAIAVPSGGPRSRTTIIMGVMARAIIAVIIITMAIITMAIMTWAMVTPAVIGDGSDGKAGDGACDKGTGAWACLCFRAWGGDGGRGCERGDKGEGGDGFLKHGLSPFRSNNCFGFNSVIVACLRPSHLLVVVMFGMVQTFFDCRAKKDQLGNFELRIGVFLGFCAGAVDDDAGCFGQLAAARQFTGLCWQRKNHGADNGHGKGKKGAVTGHCGPDFLGWG